MNKEETDLVRGNNRFALNLYRELARQNGNIFVSPYTVSTVMAIAHSGARGLTREEIREAFHFPATAASLLAEFGALSDEMRRGVLEMAEWGADVGALGGDLAIQGYELASAVGLWAQQDHQFRSDFLGECERHFEAGLNRIDFRKDPDQIRQAVNAWVSEQTSGAIEELTLPDLENPLNRLLVCSAVYFQSMWVAPFEKEQTRTSEFRVSKHRTVQVPMMHQNEEFEYAEAGDVRVLELKYMEDEASMVILLPEEDDGLPELERNLSPERLDAYLRELRRAKVDVYLPRFKIGFEADIAPSLQKMGLDTAFDGNRADFSGIDGKKQWLYLGPIIHKACVDVDEVGTVAAASTAAMLKALGVVGPGVFRADHPFLFLIRHNRTGSILFVGRVTDPSA